MKKTKENKFEFIGLNSEKKYVRILTKIFLASLGILILGLFINEDELATNNLDKTISKLNMLCIILAYSMPYLIMCNIFGIKNKLPFFKKNTKSNNIIGCFLVFVIFACFASMLLEFATDEYKLKLKAQDELETGEISKQKQKEKETNEKQKEEEQLEKNDEKDEKQLAKEKAEKEKLIKELEEQQRKEQEEQQRLAVTFDQIYYDYKSNKLVADDKYKNNRYRITAKINGMSTSGILNWTGGATLTMEKLVGNTTVYFYAEFEKEQEDELKTIKVGDTITFEGEYLSAGSWSDCELK